MYPCYLFLLLRLLHRYTHPGSCYPTSFTGAFGTGMHSHMRSLSPSPSQSTTTSSDRASSKGRVICRSAPSCQNNACVCPSLSSSGDNPPTTTNLNVNDELCGMATVHDHVFVTRLYSIGTPRVPSHAPSSTRSPHTTTLSPNCGWTFTVNRTGTVSDGALCLLVMLFDPASAELPSLRVTRDDARNVPAPPPPELEPPPTTRASAYFVSSYLSNRRS
mmetsp:Transcript_12111/g.45048  ORF Transcript_12111/g.45048 Transcript_12111/m.45048 type:complete len:218 (-) Transcript_12111:682-1335(-)